MRTGLWLPLWIGGLLLCSSPAWADSSPSPEAGESQAAASAENAPADEASVGRPDRIAAQVDELTAAWWQAEGITPAELSSDEEFVRRITLDLLGRIPTAAEAQAFVADENPAKRRELARQLLSGGEWPLQLSSVLDAVIQGRYAGDAGYQNWLRTRLAQGANWRQLFELTLLGPWEGDDKPAENFLRRRIRSIDDLTNDTARSFFGVNVSCAKCHDHPLVSDWKQQHYYGMASFFNRSYEDKQSKLLVEKDEGEVQFVDTSGARHTAAIMFLSGAVVEAGEPIRDPKEKERREAALKEGRYEPPPFSPRAELVRTALEERQFFSRAIVNRLWAYLFGRGLVDPADQMHSENPPAIPGVLEWLADDLAGNDYDLRPLIEGLTLSRVYQLSSSWNGPGDLPEPSRFAMAPIRPLSPRQFGISMLLAAGDAPPASETDEQRTNRQKGLEGRARGFANSLDAPGEDFQTSIAEALFISNNEAIQQLTAPAGRNLTVRLNEIEDPAALIEAAYWTVLSRAPNDDERAQLVQWLADRPDRARGVRDLVWSLLASAEFRFNH